MRTGNYNPTMRILNNMLTCYKASEGTLRLVSSNEDISAPRREVTETQEASTCLWHAVRS